MSEIYFLYGLVILFFLGYRVLKNKTKGVRGELSVSSRLLLLNKTKYKTLNNIILTSNNYTSQIDHIIVSDFGIFVIETKNYSGWIFGSEQSEFWTQVLYKRKYKLYNPIRQNNSHVLTLKNCLKEYPDIRYIPIVVFTSKSSLSINSSSHVINSYNLNKFIKRYTEVYISEEEKEEIVEKLNFLSDKSGTSKKQHIATIKERNTKKAELISQNICPKCGGNLVSRNSKFGSFKGCTNYPRCTFTESFL